MSAGKGLDKDYRQVSNFAEIWNGTYRKSIVTKSHKKLDLKLIIFPNLTENSGVH